MKNQPAISAPLGLMLANTCDAGGAVRVGRRHVVAAHEQLHLLSRACAAAGAVAHIIVTPCPAGTVNEPLLPMLVEVPLTTMSTSVKPVRVASLIVQVPAGAPLITAGRWRPMWRTY